MEALATTEKAIEVVDTDANHVSVSNFLKDSEDALVDQDLVNLRDTVDRASKWDSIGGLAHDITALTENQGVLEGKIEAAPPLEDAELPLQIEDA